jgi:hypothetical protein
MQLDESPTRSGPGPWARLSRFRDALEHERDLPGQLQATVRAARTECGADVAFWYSGPKSETVLLDTEPTSGIDLDWCRAVARAALGSTPDGLAGSWTPANPPALDPRPTSAVFARLRPRRLGWLIAVGTGPDRAMSPDAVSVLRYLGRTMSQHQEHRTLADGLRGALNGLFKMLVSLVDARDPYMSGHGERVARIARRIGEELRLSGPALNDLYLAGLLHDVGTLGLPDQLLHHPGKLTNEEMAQMRRHVLIGDEILASAKHVDRVRPGVRNHHERWDGKGYPDGLKGEEIPLVARVVAVADACDALMSARRYRPPLGPPQIIAVLRRFGGSQWDPAVVEAFVACGGDIFPPIYQKGVGESALYALSDVVASDVERSTILHAVLGGSTAQDRQ